MREIALAHTLVGSPYAGTERTDTHSAGREVTRAQHSGIEYVGHTRCWANSYTCQAPQAKGTNFCVGHLKSMEKQAREQG